ncbi:hypothetical protein ACFFJI_08320 [Allobacillus sp. GCM10007491]|nr:hypothetical protein [Allobacillus saliphilus]
MDREKQKTTDEQPPLQQKGSSKSSSADHLFTDKERKQSEKDQHTRGGF